jgi:hypothetical protein
VKSRPLSIGDAVAVDLSDGGEALCVDADSTTRSSPAPADAEEPARRRGTDRVVARVVHTKGRIDASRVGHEHRRLRLAVTEPSGGLGEDRRPGIPPPRLQDAEPLVDRTDGV